MIYLAIPYSFNPEKSFKKANKLTAYLISKGYTVFSPISHSHPISNYMNKDLQKDSEFWLKQDIEFLKYCNMMIVYCFGKEWLNSYGVQKEIEYCFKNNIKIKFIGSYD